MFRLYRSLSRILPGRAAQAFCAAAASGLLVAVFSGCTVNEPKGSKAECFAGEPCRDAAADTRSEVVVTPDAHVEPPASTGEGGLPVLCPTECNPEDALTCASASVRQRLLSPEQPLELVVADSSSVEFGVALQQVFLSDASLIGSDASLGNELTGELSSASEGRPQSEVVATTEVPLLPSVPDAGLLDGGPDVTAARSDAGRGQLDVLDAAAGDGVGTTTPVAACQLVFRDGTLLAECSQSGSGREGSACASARDCAPGLGCVGSAGAGQCLPYCCGGNDSCGDGRYCTQRPLRSLDITDEATAPTIPVCAVADNCSLMLGPCTAPGACSCPTGLACTVVRASTTTCVEPGSGTEGDSCPCAPGYFCSQGSNTCLKFCNSNDPASGCGAGECQPGPSGFPMGWGLCVGD